MAAIFQIRRGSGSVSLVDGELYLNKSSQSLQIGTNESLNPITLVKLNDVNSGSLNISGDIIMGGTITIGDSTSDNVIFNADLSSSIIPDADRTYDLGSVPKWYRNVYANTVSASFFSGSFAGIGDLNQFSTSVDLRLDEVEATSSYLNNTFSTSVDLRLDEVEATASYLDNTFSTSVDSRLDYIEGTFSTSVDSRLDYIEGTFSTSVDLRLDEVEASASYLNNAFSTSVDARLDSLELTSASINEFTHSMNEFSNSATIRLNTIEADVSTSIDRLVDLESRADGFDVDIAQLNTYTHSLNQAIELTGSTVSFLGDIIVYGTQSILNSINFEVGDNLIYLATASVADVDFGVIGHYNDGTYHHGGIFRSAYDGAWRVFKNYAPEISGTINLTEPTFELADFRVNTLYGTIAADNGVISGSTQITNGSGILSSSNSTFAAYTGSTNTFTASANGRLNNLEQTSASVDISITNLNTFTGSQNSKNSTLATYTGSVTIHMDNVNVWTASINTEQTIQNGRLTKLEEATASLNSYTSSTTTKFDNLQTYTSSIDTKFNTLGTYTGSIDTKFNTLENVTASLLLYTASANVWSGGVDAKFNTLQSYTASINQTTASLNIWSASINSFTASMTASYLQLSASVEYLNRLSFGGIDLNAQFLTIAQVTGSLQAYTSSANSRFSNLEAATSSYETVGRGIVSGAVQIVPLLPSGVISSSAQISTAFEPIASTTHTLVSGSSQVIGILSSLNSFTSSIDTTIKTKLNVEGVLSGSSQVAGILTSLNSFTASIDTTIKTKLNTDGVLSGSAQLATTFEAIASGTHTLVSGSSQILGGSTIHSSSVGDYQFNSIGIGTAASTTAGEIRATGDITAYYSSDNRLKENIIPIVNALEKVNQISGNTYDWKEGYDEIHSHKGNDVGVIAQEIEVILPQIVTNRDNGFKAVQYEKIIPLLIEAIKELSTKVDRLENK